MARWNTLPIQDVALEVLLQAAHDGRVLIADLKGPLAPYPIVRVKLDETDQQAPA